MGRTDQGRWKGFYSSINDAVTDDCVYQRDVEIVYGIKYTTGGSILEPHVLSSKMPTLSAGKKSRHKVRKTEASAKWSYTEVILVNTCNKTVM